MSYTMCAHIIFPAVRGRGELNVYRVNSVKIESSWKMLTDTAEIVLPRRVRDFREAGRFDALFQAGDPVEIRLGYNGNLYTEFTGYIAVAAMGTPIVLKCEDEMYRLKRRTVSISLPGCDLKTLLKKIAPSYEMDCYEGIGLGSVRYTNVTAAQVLEDVQKNTGQYCYFDGKVLRCGKVYADQADAKPVRVELERNVVSEDLKNAGGADAKIEVKATSILKGGKKLEVKVGDPGGVVKQLSYVGITVKSDLEKKAKSDLERLKKRRFEGKVKLFGIPRAVHGQCLELTSIVWPEMDGMYCIDKVTKEFSDRATYRQVLELGDTVK